MGLGLTAQLVHWHELQNPEASSHLEALEGGRRALCVGFEGVICSDPSPIVAGDCGNAGWLVKSPPPEVSCHQETGHPWTAIVYP